MAALPFNNPRFFARDPDDDTPLVGGLVYTYMAGTTTPKLTWADYAQTSARTNPIVLEADGGADLFGSGAYKIIVRRPDNTLVHEIDNVVIGNEGNGNAINNGEVIYTTDHMVTSADDGLTLIANRPTAITFALDNAVTLGPNFAVIIKNIGLGTLTLDPSLTDLIDGAATKVMQSGSSAIVTSNGTGFRTFFLYDAMIDQKIAAAVAAVKADVWSAKAIGEPFPIFSHLAGCPIPVNNADHTFITLSAGAGAGFNAGKLTGETVTGSFPLVQATATISFAGSPIDGQSVHLINTERRFVRAGSSGAVEQDAFEDHVHTTPWRTSGAQFATGGVQPVAEPGSTTNTSGGIGRVSVETRGKNVGAEYFMRIK